MEREKQRNLSKSDIISASEIGQYHYCSIAWHLQKSGYEPKSVLLEEGIKKHIQLGNIIDETEINIKKSRVFALIGYILLVIAIFIFLFEVIL